MPHDEKLAPTAPGGAVELPDWYPGWARELADLYFSGTTCLFLLHGNVHDLIRCPDGSEQTYCGLPEFLATQLFGSWDLVLHYDLARGLRQLLENPAQREELGRRGRDAVWQRFTAEAMARTTAAVYGKYVS